MNSKKLKQDNLLNASAMFSPEITERIKDGYFEGALAPLETMQHELFIHVTGSEDENEIKWTYAERCDIADIIYQLKKVVKILKDAAVSNGTLHMPLDSIDNIREAMDSISHDTEIQKTLNYLEDIMIITLCMPLCEGIVLGRSEIESIVFYYRLYKALIKGYNRHYAAQILSNAA